MKFGNKKPEKIPMYVYYIIAGVIIVLLNMLVVPAVQERSVQKTDYSTFIENVEDGNVTKATAAAQTLAKKRVNLHTLRHIAACHLYESGNDIVTIQS